VPQFEAEIQEVMKSGAVACRCVGVSALVTPKGYENLAQGGGFAEPWVGVFYAICPVGAIDSTRETLRPIVIELE